MTRLAILPAALFLAAGTLAQVQSSTVEIRPSDAPGAAAEVVFRNSAADSTTSRTVALTMGGIAVFVDVTVGNGSDPDTITVTPPEDLMAIPPSITISDGETGKIVLYPRETVAG